MYCVIMVFRVFGWWSVCLAVVRVFIDIVVGG